MRFGVSRLFEKSRAQSGAAAVTAIVDLSLTAGRDRAALRLALVAVAALACDPEPRADDRERSVTVVEPPPTSTAQDNVDPTETSDDARAEIEAEEQSEPVLSHPVLSRLPAGAKRSADMLSRIDEDGYGWAIEEGWGTDGKGRTTRVSGLTKVRKIKSTATRREWLQRHKPPRSTRKDHFRRSPHDKIDPELLIGGADGLVDVAIRVKKVQRGTIDDQLMAVALRRKLETPAELQRARDVLVKRRAADIAAAQAPVRRAIESLGGEVTYTPVALFGLNARIPRAALEKLSALSEVEIISGNHRMVDGSQASVRTECTSADECHEQQAGHGADEMEEPPSNRAPRK